MQKIKTKAFANLVISVLLLGFEFFAWEQTKIIKTTKLAAVHPNTFPRIMIIGMAVFTVVLLVQSIIKMLTMKPDDAMYEKPETICPVNKQMVSDVKALIKSKGKAEIKPNNNYGVLAALFMICLCILYVSLFKSLGYVVVSMLISLIIMLLIGVRKPLQLILISILVPLGMWLVFYKMLQVNIPMGILQPLRDLIDTIRF